jgi:hypothetical protein
MKFTNGNSAIIIMEADRFVNAAGKGHGMLFLTKGAI